MREIKTPGFPAYSLSVPSAMQLPNQTGVSAPADAVEDGFGSYAGLGCLGPSLNSEII